MLLSVIIVNYNVKYFLEQSLCSLKAALVDIDAEIFVVDNYSADGSIDYLQPLFPWVTFIQNNTNEGFAKANNKALQLAKGKYILFLNPDTILAEDSLQQCIQFFTRHADAGAVGVRMIDGAGAFLPESKRAFPSPAVSFYKLTGLSSLLPKSRFFNRYALGFLPEKAVHQVEVLAGAFMMVRKAVLDITGGFDEQFFMYAEDIDLSYRIQQAGYKNYYLGNLTIVHFKGESTKKGSLNYVKTFYQAMHLFVQKHYSGGGAWLLHTGLYTGILLRQTVAAIALPFNRKKASLHPSVFDNIYTTGDALQSQIVKEMIKIKHPGAVVHYITEVMEIKAYEGVAIVFCIGSGLTYEEAIRISQTFSAAVFVMWSGRDTCSIAGSNNKNTSGWVWN